VIYSLQQILLYDAFLDHQKIIESWKNEFWWVNHKQKKNTEQKRSQGGALWQSRNTGKCEGNFPKMRTKETCKINSSGPK
jgi:hypothetical protein